MFAAAFWRHMTLGSEASGVGLYTSLGNEHFLSSLTFVAFSTSSTAVSAIMAWTVILVMSRGH